MNGKKSFPGLSVFVDDAVKRLWIGRRQSRAAGTAATAAAGLRGFVLSVNKSSSSENERESFPKHFSIVTRKNHH
jgi:hypothetical protein